MDRPTGSGGWRLKFFSAGDPSYRIGPQSYIDGSTTAPVLRIIGPPAGLVLI